MSELLGPTGSNAGPTTKGTCLRRAYLVLAGVFLVLVAGELYVGWSTRGWLRTFNDYDFCMGLARNWVADGSYFLPRQLNGPYLWQWGDVLYPPFALWLFVPFTYLPTAAWFAIPAAVVSAALWALRPAPWALAVMALLLCEPVALVETVSGNPLSWFVAIEFAALAWRAPASLALFKTALFPFALAGINTRRWWAGAALLTVLSLPFLSLSITWVRVILDVQGRSGLTYNIDQFAYALIPYVAWLGSSRSDGLRRQFARWQSRVRMAVGRGDSPASWPS
jgi:hypothetical protein